MNWLIATPTWGERCIGLFVDTALPAIRAAAARASGTVRFMVHTDDPKRIKQALHPFEHRVIPLPKGDNTPHVILGNAHRGAIAEARSGECVAFINADMVPSIEVFEAAERRFAEGKRMIVMAATRTLGGEPPVGASSRDLLRWTMDNQHPIITECFWETGRSNVPWAIYFQRGDDIVLRGFHLHPFAVMKDREIRFRRKTIDADLPDNFQEHEIHLVTSADEAAFAELSPPASFLKLCDQISVESIVAWAKGSATSRHRWFWGHRIAICGDGKDCGDKHVCKEVLRLLRR